YTTAKLSAKQFLKDVRYRDILSLHKIIDHINNSKLEKIDKKIGNLINIIEEIQITGSQECDFKAIVEKVIDPAIQRIVKEKLGMIGEDLALNTHLMVAIADLNLSEKQQKKLFSDIFAIFKDHPNLSREDFEKVINMVDNPGHKKALSNMVDHLKTKSEDVGLNTRLMEAVGKLKDNTNPKNNDTLCENVMQIFEENSGYGKADFKIIKGMVKDVAKKNILEAMRSSLGAPIGLIDRKDGVVCRLSQGLLGGPTSCAFNCLEAANAFLTKKEKAFDNAPKILDIIRAGIEKQKAKGPSGLEEPSELLKMDPRLQFVVPKNMPNVERMECENRIEKNIPFSGIIGTEKPLKNDLKIHLEALRDFKDKDVCGILTCNNETVMVAFTQSGKAILFDSHGRPYKNQHLGASVRFFNDAEKLTQHLKQLYGDPSLPFTLCVVEKR
ncbi:MAG: hypothetical protein WCG42_04435, partial [Parachlamydiaceae bacterium]